MLIRADTGFWKGRGSGKLHINYQNTLHSRRFPPLYEVWGGGGGVPKSVCVRGGGGHDHPQDAPLPGSAPVLYIYIFQL